MRIYSAQKRFGRNLSCEVVEDRKQRGVNEFFKVRHVIHFV